MSWRRSGCAAGRLMAKQAERLADEIKELNGEEAERIG
jgi:hypothetical protein